MYIRVEFVKACEDKCREFVEAMCTVDKNLKFVEAMCR